MVRAKLPISKGYNSLADIVYRQLCCLILTTNFDTLIADSIRDHKPIIPKPKEINRTKDDLSVFNQFHKCQIVYLHGAVEYYTDRILEEETNELNSELIRLLRPSLSSCPLIVIGYRGAEKSIMIDLLRNGVEESNQYRNGIYWCGLKDESLNDHVSTLAEKIGTNFKHIEIEGFDELMTRINDELNEEYCLSEPTSELPITEVEFEDKLVDGKWYEDLDENLIKNVLTKYFERLITAKVEPSQYKDWLFGQYFLIKKDDRLIPTTACFLIFGKDVTNTFTYVKTLLEIDDKDRIVFDGNLIEQYNKLIEFFDSRKYNPYLRIKKEKSSEERLAYSPRAITEMLTNMFVHRDYCIREFNKIKYYTGKEIQFITPGGLPRRVCNGVVFQEDLTFQPIRGLSDIRNRLIADIFFGLGSMDKAGSGMPDVIDFMAEHDGQALFRVLNNNTSLVCTLQQAIQTSPRINNIAKPVSKSELYITNLLPFKLLPTKIYLMPLRPLTFRQILPLLPHSEILPVYITDIHDEVRNKKLISFVDLSIFEEYFNNIVDFDEIEEINVERFILDTDNQKRFSWLIIKHWEFYLYQFEKQGLFVDYKSKRAYFLLTEGRENKITYQSRMNRKATRAVVKRRETKRRTFHENEGISFRIDHLGKQWCISIKPIYMFTKKDGKTPMESYLRGKYSTSRFRFDRNKNVDDDLHFWLKFLSKGDSAINIGGIDVDDLMLDAKYVECEVPILD
jgi:hypothetical protein